MTYDNIIHAIPKINSLLEDVWSPHLHIASIIIGHAEKSLRNLDSVKGHKVTNFGQIC